MPSFSEALRTGFKQGLDGVKAAFPAIPRAEVGQAAREALADPSAQAEATRAVKDAVVDTYNKARQDLLPIVKSASDAIPTGDTRSNYEKARALLGDNATDKWYHKLLKNVGAGLISVGVPVITFISAFVATKISPHNSSAAKEEFRNSFRNIYGGLLSALAPQTPTTPTRRRPAARPRPAAGTP